MASKQVPQYYCNHCGNPLKKPDAAYYTIHHVSDMPGTRHGVTAVFKGQKVPLGEDDTRTDYCCALCLSDACDQLAAKTAAASTPPHAGTPPAE